ncbi:hypothetical protein UC317_2444 [Lactococcus lactis subsp. lactis]|nr:hypothetical protein BSR25_0703 [Lactococcus lactis subsp. lactis bv. diacetylactis]KST76860.1 hypothetical protein ATCC19435_2200 [Lactococcus lactis subsp. lactis]KSU18259.1 hypothetical protein LMG14418_1639 [Lactococcus lactis subsp. lactis]KSU23302.1 hypothetical protein ML8_2445 [Lactococcus lactis subsp. lactis]KSU30827.1 hypothetical protein UC317_2444 [Lactococcus lactis subsp. lactis]
MEYIFHLYSLKSFNFFLQSTFNQPKPLFNFFNIFITVKENQI